MNYHFDNKRKEELLQELNQIDSDLHKDNRSL